MGAIQSHVINILRNNTTLNSDINAEPGDKETKVITIITMTTSDIIHRPVFYLKKRDVSETGFCLHLQVEPTQMRPIRTKLCLRTIITSMWLKHLWLWWPCVVAATELQILWHNTPVRDIMNNLAVFSEAITRLILRTPGFLQLCTQQGPLVFVLGTLTYFSLFQFLNNFSFPPRPRKVGLVQFRPIFPFFSTVLPSDVLLLPLDQNEIWRKSFCFCYNLYQFTRNTVLFEWVWWIIIIIIISSSNSVSEVRWFVIQLLYLTTMSVSRLHGVYNVMVDDYAAVREM
jgi:hypothetical protein